MGTDDSFQEWGALGQDHVRSSNAAPIFFFG